MYVCVCNAIRECDFRRAARCVPGDAEAIYAALGKTPKCRQCLDEANEMLLEERQSARQFSLVA